jgi:EAL domain-containing protein (putative c-di-GMP-specific phosphodiesterase class I)
MASFGYLKNLPVDILKIDGSFIRDMQSDPVSLSMVRALTQIGHQLGLEVIAEWVSTERELELVREVGVDYVQGYAVHRPETALPWRDGG